MLIAITSHDGKALAKPTEFLGERFAAYRRAVAGGKYDGELKGNLLPIDRVPMVKAALEIEGFEVAVDPAIAATFVARVDALKGRVDAAIARIVEAQARVIDRDLTILPYQKNGIPWLAARKKGLITDDPGLGKTMQLLLAVESNPRVLCVCPASVKYNWKDEVKDLWRPDLKVTILEGKGSFRWPEAGEIVVINYDILPGDLSDMDENGRRHVISGSIPEIPASDSPLYLLADECHLIKSSKAQRTIRFKALAKKVRAADGSAWGATGTELQNHPGELWTLYDAFDVAKEAFGDWPTFVRLFGGVKTRFGIQWPNYTEEPEAIDPSVPERMRLVSLKRLKKDVLKDLPEKRYQTMEVDLDPETIKLCDEVVSHLRSRGVDIDTMKDVIEITRFKGAGFDLISKAMSALAAAKTTPALEIVESYEEANEPLVVFSAYRAPVDLLGKRAGWETITGDTKKSERQAIVKRFQAGQLKGIAGTIDAMGVGLTMTRSCNVLLIDRDWTPALNRQAVDRLHRLGQVRGVLVMVLVGQHELERRLATLLLRKSALEDATSMASARQETEDAAAEDLARLRAEATALLTSAQLPVGAVWSASTPVSASVTLDKPTVRRPAASDLERWAGAGITLLAGSDPDRARELNGVGFSKFDAEWGHELAGRLQSHGGLTDKEWAAAVRLSRRYRRQLPQEPAAE